MEEKKIAFKLSKVNWILALSVIGISALIFLRRDGINGFSLGYLFGSIVTSAIIPLFFAFIVWLIKGRKLYAGTYTFNIVLVLMCFGMIKELGAISKEKTDSVDAISKSVSEYKHKINNEEDGIDAYQEHMANVDDGISKMIRNSTGNEQEVYKNLQKFTSINSSVMLDWQKSVDSVPQERILDYSLLNNQAEFDYQIGVLKHYKNQSESYKNHFENRKSILIDLNKNIPKGNLTLKGVMTGINKKDSIQKPIFEPFIKSHIDYSNDLLEIVEFLQDNQGKWEYKNDELTFSAVALEEKYSTLINKIAEDENRINELTDKLIEAM
ncbi:stage II sporulation protein M [Pseudotamlana agarivorans]|uniref:stage II sporulation protein M n=1 Tax=Pseudotamlana agarivorans TaxID=481183 RepID=UPI00082B084A|nr:stage II sporulation protein M [Tamlana agarivorans]